MSEPESITCSLGAGCAFEGDWPSWLAHAPTHTLPHPDDRAAWLLARRTFIGASEIAAVCGLSPWQTALDVYAAKVTGETKRATPAMRRGLMLEPVLLASYSERHGVDLVRPSAQRHPDYPFIGATPDAQRADDGSLVEIKTVDARGMSRWSEDDPPLHVVMQVQQQLAVFGAERAHVVALLGSDMLEHEYEVRYDAKAASQACELAGIFWEECVVPRVLPVDFDGTPSDETLRMLFPQARAGMGIAPPDVIDLARRYVETRATESAAGKLKDELAGQIKARIGDAEGYQWAGGKVTWKNAKGSLDKDGLVEELFGELDLGAPERQRLIEKYTAAVGSRRLNVVVKGE